MPRDQFSAAGAGFRSVADTRRHSGRRARPGAAAAAPPRGLVRRQVAQLCGFPPDGRAAAVLGKKSVMPREYGAAGRRAGAPSGRRGPGPRSGKKRFDFSRGCAKLEKLMFLSGALQCGKAIEEQVEPKGTRVPLRTFIVYYISGGPESLERKLEKKAPRARQPFGIIGSDAEKNGRAVTRYVLCPRAGDHRRIPRLPPRRDTVRPSDLAPRPRATSITDGGKTCAAFYQA